MRGNDGGIAADLNRYDKLLNLIIRFLYSISYTLKFTSNSLISTTVAVFFLASGKKLQKGNLQNEVQK